MGDALDELIKRFLVARRIAAWGVDPPQAMTAAQDRIAAAVPLVWLHDAMSPGAATPEAIERLRAAVRLRKETP